MILAKELTMTIRNLGKTLVALPLALFLPLTLSFSQESRSQPAPAPQAKVFVFVQRTDAHAKYSKSEVFHDAMNDFLAFLKEENVAVAVDEFGGRNFAESATPLDTVFKIARESDATSVLYLVIDRPMSKWIKMTAQCFDMNQKQLWKEEASNSSSMSGGAALKSTEKRLRERLEPRVGKEGLPVLPSTQPASDKK
jgi:hypothetical protein